MTPLTVTTLFESAAARFPTRDAIQAGDVTITYEDLCRRVRQAAVELTTEYSLRPGDRVAIVARNGPDYLASVLSCALAGYTVVPVNVHLTAPEMAYIMVNADVSAVVVDDHYAESVGVALKGSAVASAVIVDCKQLGLDVHPGDKQSHVPLYNPGDKQSHVPLYNDLLYLGYTSGTTGLPKGARVTQGNRATAILLQAAEFKLGSNDVHLVVAPLYHTAPLTFALLHLALAGTVVLHPRFDETMVAQSLLSGMVTSTFLAPSALKRVLHVWPSASVVSPGVRAIIIGGSPCPVDVKKRAIAAFPNALYEFYGATEAGIVTILHPVEQASHYGSAGRVFPGAVVEVRDRRTGAVLPAGVAGDIWLSTCTMADGYHGPNAVVPQPEAICLGDIGFLDAEGYLTLVDRSADVIISGGVNVYTREIELVLEEESSVEEAAVFGVPDPDWGEAVVAAVRLRPGSIVAEEELERICRTRLASYKRPRIFRFVNELPRNASGKVLKRRLRQEFLAITEPSDRSSDLPATDGGASDE